MAVDVVPVMREIAVQLATIEGLQVYDRPVSRITATPAAIVWTPERVTFDRTARRSKDSLRVPIFVVLSRTDHAAIDKLGPYASGVGERSIKTVLEGPADSGAYEYISGLIVEGGEYVPATFAGVEYLAVVLTANVLA